jgi:hypothetical protein
MAIKLRPGETYVQRKYGQILTDIWNATLHTLRRFPAASKDRDKVGKLRDDLKALETQLSASNIIIERVTSLRGMNVPSADYGKINSPTVSEEMMDIPPIAPDDRFPDVVGKLEKLIAVAENKIRFPEDFVKVAYTFNFVSTAGMNKQTHSHNTRRMIEARIRFIAPRRILEDAGFNKTMGDIQELLEELVDNIDPQYHDFIYQPENEASPELEVNTDEANSQGKHSFTEPVDIEKPKFRFFLAVYDHDQGVEKMHIDNPVSDRWWENLEEGEIGDVVREVLLSGYSSDIASKSGGGWKGRYMSPTQYSKFKQKTFAELGIVEEPKASTTKKKKTGLAVLKAAKNKKAKRKSKKLSSGRDVLKRAKAKAKANAKAKKTKKVSRGMSVLKNIKAKNKKV